MLPRRVRMTRFVAALEGHIGPILPTVLFVEVFLGCLMVLELSIVLTVSDVNRIGNLRSSERLLDDAEAIAHVVLMVVASGRRRHCGQRARAHRRTVAITAGLLLLLAMNRALAH